MRRSWGALLDLQHFGCKGACWSSGIGITKNDKQINYSHGLAQTKQQVGQCIVGAFLVYRLTTGKHGFKKLTTTRIWGRNHLPLYSILCAQPQDQHPNVILSWDESLKILKIETPTTLDTHKFVCKPPIEVSIKAKLQSSLRAFQQYVARHLHALKSRRFPTFSDRKSNWKFHSPPFSQPSLVFQLPKWVM